METWLKSTKSYWRSRDFLYSFIGAMVLLIASLILNYHVGLYVEERASGPVTDLILSNIRVYDLDGVFIYGSTFLVLLIIAVCLWKPQRAAFVVKNIALFVVIRSIFMSLTHIGPFPTRVIVDPTSFLRYFTFGADLFFSGHTGLPFLIALIFWDDKMIRYIFIGLSLIFGVVVLLAHLHYSIDVLGAFFITHTIYHIGKKIFRPEFSFKM